MCIINITWFFILFFIFFKFIFFFFLVWVCRFNIQNGENWKKQNKKKIHNFFFFILFFCSWNFRVILFLFELLGIVHFFLYLKVWWCLTCSSVYRVLINNEFSWIFLFFFSPVRANTRLFVIVYTLPVCVSVRVCVCVGAPKFWLIEIRWFYFFPAFVPLSFWKKTNSFINYYVFYLHPKSQTTKTCAILCSLPPSFHALLNIYLMTIWYYYFSFSLCLEITNRRIRGVENKLKKMKKKDNKILKLIT